MASSQSITSKYNGGADPTFSLEKTIAHVTRRANFKSIGPNYVAKKTVMNRLRILIDGNTAGDRYRRWAFDGSQRVTAAILSEQHRACRLSPDSPVKLDLAHNKHVKSRFWRQDNVRFNRALREENEKGNLSSRGKWTMRLSRWAHHANGVTELGAAPTGMTQKCIKIGSAPSYDDRTARGHLRILFSLAVVFSAVTAVSRGLALGLGNIGNSSPASIKKEVAAMVSGFNAIAASASLFSLFFSGCSAAIPIREPLEKGLVDNIEGNKNRHVQRLYLLLNDAKAKPAARILLLKAMKRGVGKDYRLQDKMPVLLDRLMADVRTACSGDAAVQAMEKTIGSYLTEVDPKGSTPGQLLNPDTHKAELLRRENHFIALTNLIEHSAIDENKDKIFRDARHSIERAVEFSQQKLSTTLGAKILRCCGANKLANRVDLRNSPEFQKVKAARDKSPYFASKNFRSAENILDNPHQYGPVTVNLTRAAEFLRVVNHSILLSLNYQLTRPLAWLSGRITESMFKAPNSRSTSFSIGRFFSSASWATMDAMLMLNLAGGNGVGLNGPEAHTAVKFPLYIRAGGLSVPVSIISTAAQMIVLAVPALIFMGAAKVALEIEGWKGDTQRSVQGLHKRRQVMEGWS